MKKIYAITFGFLVSVQFLTAQTTTTFNYTGSMQTFVVPPCVNSITVDMSGAEGGGDASVFAPGGGGGRVQATLTVVPGQTLTIFIGGQGNLTGTPGYNGGGSGINGSGGTPGGGGGGASDIRIGGTLLTDRVIVAGGGGGGTENGGASVGGAGGGLIGGTGGLGGNPWGCTNLTAATGGTQGVGGLGGTSTSCAWNGSNGTFGVGGNTYMVYRSAGGGGGWYGGGGAHNGCSGGGGSSYTNGLSIGVLHTQGFRTGNGIATITYTSSVPPTPGVITGSSSVCANATGNYSIVSIPGATTYTWTVPTGSTINSGQGTTSINLTAGNTSGNISVTVTVPCGTSSPSTFVLTIIPSPTVTATSSSASVCTGGSVTLTGGGAATYAWDNNVVDAISFVPTATTTYMVTGTDVNGCVNTATTTVTVNPLPVVTANSSSASVCTGGSVILTGGGASTYTWNNNVIDAISFVPTATTTYMVTGTDANGCVNTATTTVTVNPLPVVTAASSAATLCSGGSVTLTGGGASTYIWDNNVIDAVSFVPTATTTYMVTGTDANGCMNTAIITVTVNPLPIVSLGPNIIQCGGTALLDAGNIGSVYLWNNASTTQTITVSASGTYIVVVTNINGCTGSDTALVTINSIPTVTASASSVVVCVDDATVSLTGTPTGGVWSGPGVTGSTLSPTSAGVGLHTAIYSYTDGNGCEGITSVNVQVNACVGLAENILANGVSVYPNPNNGSFTLGVNANVAELTIKITDMQGRVVYASVDKNVNAGFVKQISLDTQSSGMYLMHIIANGEQQTKKISVQK